MSSADAGESESFGEAKQRTQEFYQAAMNDGDGKVDIAVWNQTRATGISGKARL